MSVLHVNQESGNSVIDCIQHSVLRGLRHVKIMYLGVSSNGSYSLHQSSIISVNGWVHHTIVHVYEDTIIRDDSES